MANDSTVRAAAYLVRAEVRNAVEAAARIRDGEAFTFLPVDAWHQARLLLAEPLRPTDWEALAVVYQRIHGYNWRVQANVLESSGEKSRVLDDLTGAADAASAALTELDRLAQAQ